MLQRLPPVGRGLRGYAAGLQVAPHWLLEPSTLGDVKRQIRHRGRPVLPGWKGTRLLRPRRGPEDNAERRGAMRGLRPALPELGSASLIATRFRDISDPHQLEHEVAEEEATAGCALPRMFVRRSFQQTKLPQTAGAWRADDGANEHMIDFDRHLTQLSWLESRLLEIGHLVLAGQRGADSPTGEPAFQAGSRILPGRNPYPLAHDLAPASTNPLISGRKPVAAMLATEPGQGSLVTRR